MQDRKRCHLCGRRIWRNLRVLHEHDLPEGPRVVVVHGRCVRRLAMTPDPLCGEESRCEG